MKTTPGLKTTKAKTLLRCIVFTTLAAFTAHSARPAVAYASPSDKIPTSPSAPPALKQDIPVNRFGCQRKFTYQGNVLDCDSQVRRDGEGLRPIIKDVPSAVAELDAYQSGRKAMRYTAYAATLGVLIALTGYLSNSFGNKGHVRKNPEPGQEVGPLTWGSYFILGGALMATGTFVFGVSTAMNNESHLHGAVEEFNKARPNTPIGLEFKAGIKF